MSIRLYRATKPETVLKMMRGFVKRLKT